MNKKIGNFEFIQTKIEDLYIIKSTRYSDERGYFMECYHQPSFSEMGIDVSFIQDNQSKSRKGVLRGMHFQTSNMQGKLVRVIKGKVFDVAVDLRKGSPTYGEWESVILSEDNYLQFYVPEGFAHGFLVLSDEAEFVYKCTNVYDPNSEGGIMWNDPLINIKWPLNEVDKVILSEKDKKRSLLKDKKIEL